MSRLCGFLTEAATVWFLDQGEVLADSAAEAVAGRAAGKGIESAGGGPIRVNPAPVGGDERALTVGSVFESQRDDRQAGFRSDVPDGVGFEKLSRRKPQPVFQPQYVIRGQCLVQIAAACVEARHRRRAVE